MVQMFCRSLPQLATRCSSLKSIVVVAQRRYGYTHWLCYAFSDVVVHCSKTSFVGGTAQVRYGVRKTQPIEIMLNDYSKYYWDDSVTEDDPLVGSGSVVTVHLGLLCIVLQLLLGETSTRTDPSWLSGGSGIGNHAC